MATNQKPLSAYAQKLAEMRESLETASKTPEIMSGAVIFVDLTTAGEIYGDVAKDATREMIQVQTRVKETGDTFKTAFTLPYGAISWRNKDFKLGKYVSKYGDLPEVGQTIQVKTGDNGFYDIVL